MFDAEVEREWSPTEWSREVLRTGASPKNLRNIWIEMTYLVRLTEGRDLLTGR